MNNLNQYIVSLLLIILLQGCVVYSGNSLQPTQEAIDAENSQNRFKEKRKRNYVLKLNNEEQIKFSSIIKFENDSIYYTYSYRSIDELMHEERVINSNEVKEIKYKNKTLSATVSVFGIIIPVAAVTFGILWSAFGGSFV